MTAREQLQTVVAERVAGDLHWSVSATTGTDIDGAILNVTLFAAGPQCRIVGKGDHDGRQFPDGEAAMQFALEHGYLRRYFTSPSLRARRVARAA